MLALIILNKGYEVFREKILVKLCYERGESKCFQSNEMFITEE